LTFEPEAGEEKKRGASIESEDPGLKDYAQIIWEQCHRTSSRSGERGTSEGGSTSQWGKRKMTNGCVKEERKNAKTLKGKGEGDRQAMHNVLRGGRRRGGKVMRSLEAMCCFRRF